MSCKPFFTCLAFVWSVACMCIEVLIPRLLGHTGIPTVFTIEQLIPMFVFDVALQKSITAKALFTLLTLEHFFLVVSFLVIPQVSDCPKLFVALVTGVWLIPCVDTLLMTFQPG